VRNYAVDWNKSLKSAELTTLLNWKSTRDGGVRDGGNATLVSSLLKEEEEEV
jgi:hypothetical protein